MVTIPHLSIVIVIFIFHFLIFFKVGPHSIYSCLLSIAIAKPQQHGYKVKQACVCVLFFFHSSSLHAHVETFGTRFVSSGGRSFECTV